PVSSWAGTPSCAPRRSARCAPPSRRWAPATPSDPLRTARMPFHRTGGAAFVVSAVPARDIARVAGDGGEFGGDPLGVAVDDARRSGGAAPDQHGESDDDGEDDKKSNHGRKFALVGFTPKVAVLSLCAKIRPDSMDTCCRRSPWSSTTGSP